MESSNLGLNSPSFDVSLKQFPHPLTSPTSPANLTAPASPFLSAPGFVQCILFLVHYIKLIDAVAIVSFSSQPIGIICLCSGFFSHNFSLSTRSWRSRTGPGPGSRPRRLLGHRHDDACFLDHRVRVPFSLWSQLPSVNLALASRPAALSQALSWRH